MGVPTFYRWLTEKYFNIVAHVKEDKDGDVTDPNPNGLEFDHLYLDMNGIIHPCFHPDNLIFPPITYEEVFENIYAYIDRLFSIVRPRKLLYLAIDGVAPRAKMNQQRSRRFRTAKDNEIAEEEEKRLRDKYERLGKKLLPVLESQVSDSSVITPGTEFMDELSKALRSYINKKLDTDPGWKEIKVILSDATVPGEGEHKVMSFIRSLRSVPGYDPNTRHCLHGLDADLIMLALATHEVHFSILREDVITVPHQKPDPELALETTISQIADHCLQTSAEGNISLSIRDRNQSSAPILPQQFQFVHVWILREYLELELQIVDPPDKFVFDIERIVDDFVFICFFLGNDFLPHMPTLEIHEYGIDLLLHVYKKEFKKLGGYLVDMQRVNDQHAGYIKLKRVEKFILSVGSYEEKVFKKRTELMERKQRRMLADLAESRKNEVDEESSEICTTVSPCVEQHETLHSNPPSISVIKQMVENTKEFKEELKQSFRKSSDVLRNGLSISDKVKLGSAGYQQRYYKEKFSVEDPKEIEFKRKEIVQKYTEGLCWVLMYYFSGVPSWDWYYSEYYGLFASEMKGISQVKVNFSKGLPFKPFDQLMAVLPPRSAHALPEAYRELMISSDSKIAEFYPRVFQIDTDGKRFLWQGICKLPFIDQEKLLKATCELKAEIKETEAIRNVETTDHLFWRGSQSCAGVIWDYIEQHTEKTVEVLLAVDKEHITCRDFKLPATDLQVPRLLEGVQLPEKTVFEHEIEETPLWHEYFGHRRPVTRVPPQRDYRKAAATDESVTHKYAGTGWTGAGRGRGLSSSLSEDHSNVGQSARSGSSRGWFKQHPAAAPDSNRNRTPASNLNRRVETMKISPSQANNSPSYRRATEYNKNTSFWSSGGAADSPQNLSWRPASYAAAVRHQTSPWRPASSATATAASHQTGPWRPPSLANRSCSDVGNGNSPQFAARGRGHYRPNVYNKPSSQDPNRW